VRTPQGGTTRSQPQAQEQTFGTYFQDKVRKLRDSVARKQLAATEQVQARTGGQEPSSIFRGVCVWVDGFTEPSQPEIQELMACHGGRFEHYYDSNFVTHVIANELAHTHIMRYRKMKKPPKIVRPAWLTACVSKGRLLDVAPFVLDCISADDGQVALRGLLRRTASIASSLSSTLPGHASHASHAASAASSMPQGGGCHAIEGGNELAGATSGNAKNSTASAAKHGLFRHPAAQVRTADAASSMAEGGGCHALGGGEEQARGRGWLLRAWQARCQLLV
jgi:hypothetical protein